MEDGLVDRYLARIGAARPDRVDARALRHLQLQHLLTVPFENLSIHLGEPIELDEAALLEKLVDRRRGGFCYELNGALAALLSALGFRVTLVGASVFGGSGLNPLFDHMALRVDLAEPWLVDVGFGWLARYPLRLDVTEQRDPHGVFRIIEAGEGDLDVLQDGRPQYRVELRARRLRDFEPMCWWHQTSPRSHFTQSTVCSRLTEAGRTTLSGRTLVRTIGAAREERLLHDDADLLRAYRDEFGIVLDRVPVSP